MNFISLGEIKKENRKENCWSDTSLSGSRFAKWILEPHKYNEESNLEYIQEKLEYGNKLENFIKCETIEKLGEYHKAPDFKINNFETYQRKDYKFCYANIDYCFINEFDIPVLMEIKNTETKNFNVLKERYKYQMMYYCWFFDIKEIVFTTFINGCSLKFERITFDDDDFKFVENRIKEFDTFLKTKKLPKRDEPKIEVNDEVLNENINSYETLAEQIEIKKNELQNLEIELSKNKENILNWIQSKDDIFSVKGTKFIFSQSTQKGRETWNTKKLNEYFEKNGFDNLEQFKTKGQDKIVLSIKSLKE